MWHGCHAHHSLYYNINIHVCLFIHICDMTTMITVRIMTMAATSPIFIRIHIHIYIYTYKAT